MARRIESYTLPGPVGRLEALLEEPGDGDPREIAVVCHPHPQYGGTMHNKVVHRLARGLRNRGAAVLRFNFRGVNLSEGTYAEGIGEIEDARAALRWLRERYQQLPYTLAGFSFGSRVILQLGCESTAASLLIAAGFPSGYHDTMTIETCAVPKVFIQSTHDEYGPADGMQEFFDRLAPPKQLHWVESANHFFDGGLERLEKIVTQISFSTA